jgi:DNA-binding NtrC family response regulator
MKILLISEVRHEWEQIKGVIRNNFRDVEVLCASSREEAFNYVSFDGPFGFFILDVEMKEQEPSELLVDLLEIAGDRPTIFMGREAFLQDRVPQQLYSSNEHNDNPR